MSKFLYPAAAVFALGLAALTWTMAQAEEEAAAPPIELQSIGALEVTPEGVLFLADSVGAAVYALELDLPARAKKESSADEAPMENIENLDDKIAALLGTHAREVVVQDMVVHEPSGTIFLSIHRGRGTDAKPVLLSIDPAGKIAEVSLSGIPHSRLDLADAPKFDAEARRNPRLLTVTDLEMVDGELLIAGLSNEEFASTLRRAPYPFSGSAKSTGLEIYHGAHGKYETHAPIFTFIPLNVDGKNHLLAGYLCTPLVTFPLDEVRTKDRLRGKTIAELGWGNVPTDMVPFQQDGEDWILIANSRRGAMKVKTADVLAAQKQPGITHEVNPRTGVVDYSVPTGHIAQADRLDDHHL
ncbi:MAG: hypothetical protein KDD47_24065, partial [Acidobacteria bacterium]|nr:hypothetical protein [Acidobacteriota bacterium]